MIQRSHLVAGLQSIRASETSVRQRHELKRVLAAQKLFGRANESKGDVMKSALRNFAFAVRLIWVVGRATGAGAAGRESCCGSAVGSESARKPTHFREAASEATSR